LHIVDTFNSSGICLVADGDTLFCAIRPSHPKRLPLPLPSPFAEIPDLGSEELDDEDLRVFMEKCAELIFSSDSEEEK
jgi:hypothetical protein